MKKYEELVGFGLCYQLVYKYVFLFFSFRQICESHLLFPIELILSHQYHQTPRNIRRLRADLKSTLLSDRFHRCTFEYVSEICGRNVHEYLEYLEIFSSIKEQHSPAMFVQITLSLKCESTELAGEWSLVSVRTYVLLKHRRFRTIELTKGTNVSSWR